VRLVRRRTKKRKGSPKKRSETRQGYVFEATAATSVRRVNWAPLAAFWRSHDGVVLSVLLLAAVAWASYLFFGTDDFYVYSMAVEGNLAVPEQEIFETSGLDGQSIFWIDPQHAAEVVARLPDIKAAEVSCELPNRVTVRVEERQAQVVWQWQDRQFWVDDYGVVLNPRGVLSEALIIQDDSPAPPRLGGRVDAEAVLAAQQLHDLRPQLRAVSYDPNRGLVLESQTGCPVYLGVGGDMASRLAIWEALEADLRKQGIRPAYIDLRYPQRPVYRQL